MNWMIEGAISARKAQPRFDADWMVVTGHFMQKIMGEDLAEQHLGQGEQRGYDNGENEHAHGRAKLLRIAYEYACYEISTERFKSE